LARIAEKQTNQLQKIEENSAVSAHYAEITAVNTTVLSWLAVLDRDKRNRMIV